MNTLRKITHQDRITVEKMSIFVANWIGGGKDNGEYVTANGWHSGDGDNWTDNSGRPVADPEFDTATIELRGGFRNGDVVS